MVTGLSGLTGINVIHHVEVEFKQNIETALILNLSLEARTVLAMLQK